MITDDGSYFLSLLIASLTLRFYLSLIHLSYLSEKEILKLDSENHSFWKPNTFYTFNL